MHTIVIIIHYTVCIFLIAIILLQTGKGADIGAAFGGASQTVFGSRGPATFLNKMTTIVAVVFLLTSIFLAQQAKHISVKSVVEGSAPISTETQTGTPESAAPAPTGEAGTPGPEKGAQEKAK